MRAQYRPERTISTVHTTTFVYDTDSDTAVVLEQLVVNEIVAKNDTGITDELGEFEDWIELYNPTANDIDLTGWGLTDSYGIAAPWVFPPGTIVTSQGYLLVWCDNDPDGPLHATFKIARDGETLTLLDSSYNIIDEVTFGLQAADTSWARVPDASTNWQMLDSPTPNASNGSP